MSFLDSTFPIFSLSNDKQMAATRCFFLTNESAGGLVVLSQVKRVKAHINSTIEDIWMVPLNGALKEQIYYKVGPY